MQLVLFDGEAEVGQQVHLQLIPVKIRHIVEGEGAEHLQHLVHNRGQLLRQLVVRLWGELQVAGDQLPGQALHLSLRQLQPQAAGQPGGEKGRELLLPLLLPCGSSLPRRGQDEAGGSSADQHPQIEEQPDLVIFRHGVIDRFPGVPEQIP